MIQLRIKVTKDILQRSKDCGGDMIGQNCAIAMAIGDIFPHTWVCVDRIFFYAMKLAPEPSNQLPMASTLLPQKARDFINKFDSLPPEEREEMPEMEFSIDVPEIVVRQITVEKDLNDVFTNHPTMRLV